MALDAALELSVEQLISALNKKLFMECARVQSAMPTISRALVAKLTTEVRSNASELGKNHRVLTRRFSGRCSGGTGQRSPTGGDFLEELPTARESSPSRSHRVVRHLRLRHRSEANRLLDPRLPILAQSHHF